MSKIWKFWTWFVVVTQFGLVLLFSGNELAIGLLYFLIEIPIQIIGWIAIKKLAEDNRKTFSRVLTVIQIALLPPFGLFTLSFVGKLISFLIP